MRISFYSESPDSAPGGAEQFVAALAEALSRSHQVCIVHHKSFEGEQAWAGYSGCDLSRVEFRQVARETDVSHLCRNPWKRYRAAKEWRRGLTSDCDLFIGMLHSKAPFCRARKGAMVVLFPTYEPFLGLENPARTLAPKTKRKKKPATATRAASPGREGWFASRIFRELYARWEWKRRMASYSVKLSISDFSRCWTRRRWGIATDLLYPPVKTPVSGLAKENRILSVGRFATTGHTKKQLELLNIFREMRHELPGWAYSTVGGLNETEQDKLYFEGASKFREENLVEVSANVEREQVQNLYARSKIFWHAAGFGDDHSAQPEMAEHFGLSTVEAMASGCVPVVINLGGQREIVAHGVNGFLWDSFEELKNYTRLLAGDAGLQEKMSAAARQRAEAFSIDTCLKNLVRYAGLDRT